MRTVTVQQMQQDPDATTRLAQQGPVAVLHEGRTVAVLSVDSTPTFEITEREEDQYTDNGAAQGETRAALLAAVNTSYWND